MDMFDLHPVMKLHKFLFSGKFCIENESKVDEIDMEVRTKLN